MIRLIPRPVKKLVPRRLKSAMKQWLGLDGSPESVGKGADGGLLTSGRAGRGKPLVRAFELPLPQPPAAVSFREVVPQELAISVPGRYWVPSVLEQGGLGAYEPDTSACFLAILETLPAGAAFDIGANIGAYALPAAALSTWHVVAFEPTPDLAETLEALRDENGLGFDIEMLALGKESGEATFYLSDVADTSNSLLSGFRPSARQISVPVDTVDSYCARRALHPKLLKIDTECTEVDVLLGAKRVIEEERPWIICEVLAGTTEQALADFLEPLGYHWYQITHETPLVARREIFGDRANVYRDWLFTPLEVDDNFWQALGRWRRLIKDLRRPHDGGITLATFL